MIIEENVIKSLKNSLKESGHNSIRIGINGFGWNGPIYDVVLDEQKNDDITFEENGLKFVVEKDFDLFINDIKNLNIGETANGFGIISKGSCGCKW